MHLTRSRNILLTFHLIIFDLMKLHFLFQPIDYQIFKTSFKLNFRKTVENVLKMFPRFRRVVKNDDESSLVTYKNSVYALRGKTGRKLAADSEASDVK